MIFHSRKCIELITVGLICLANLIIAIPSPNKYYKQAKSLPNIDQLTDDVSSNNFIHDETSSEHWYGVGQTQIRKHLAKQFNLNRAKNVILFLGDGMSIPTVTASRIHKGQKNGKSGEEDSLAFDHFPTVGLSKTYCVDAQVADSACSATAYLGGVKTNKGTIGVTAKVKLNDCEAQKDKSNHVSSIAEWSQNAGKSTGVVTTTRVTHASPAGAYSHIANRDWEYNTEDEDCQDIASQLVFNRPGRDFNVIFGGGLKGFLPTGVKCTRKIKGGISAKGARNDSVNLISEWRKIHKNGGKLITERYELLELDPHEVDSVLGLFAESHMSYNLDNDGKQPSLAEMTQAAIRILEKNENGYFLFVEGGRIDHGHHATKARKALDETLQFSEAIALAQNITNLDETLIVVTADHAHTMSISGYPVRGVDILGLNSLQTQDGKPYSTLSYANGKGYKNRNNLTEKSLKDKDFEYPATYPRENETHGGEDVPVYAIGPWSHLFTGVYEESVIPHLMAYASCVGSGQTMCSSNEMEN